MADWPRGQVTREFTFWCHSCEEWEQIAGAGVVARAKIDIRKMGWTKVHLLGWQCPRCRRSARKSKEK